MSHAELEDAFRALDRQLGKDRLKEELSLTCSRYRGRPHYIEDCPRKFHFYLGNFKEMDMWVTTDYQGRKLLAAVGVIGGSGDRQFFTIYNMRFKERLPAVYAEAKRRALLLDLMSEDDMFWDWPIARHQRRADQQSASAPE